MVCPVCSCTCVEYDECLRCEQDREYECSLIADGGSTNDNPVGLTLDELRMGRAAGNEGNVAEGVMHHAQDPPYQVSPSALIFREQVSPPVPELGTWVGVICEFYLLFWKEFSIVMTKGQRERVPFMRHDHFVEGWEAVGRNLVKG
ncbi:unnamed protein product [Pocillopora meandrina]|uniref:Uncharacterized protein n=1 Tax=Pocillopora meandrina TaxID=46732 RepID=A0AAU9XB26_9CNID|nr:unnamed protein product [Pocillopora meandrina]